MLNNVKVKDESAYAQQKRWFAEKNRLKARVHCFSMQVVMNKCFLLNPEKKFGANSSCRFREKRTFNFKKWRHQAEG